MKEENEKGVFSFKFSVFRDEGVPSVDAVDFELMRVSGLGRLRDFRMTICGFRMEDGTTKYANEEAWEFEVIRIPGFGSHRKVTVGIGRLEIFWLSDLQIIRLGRGEMEISNFEYESRTVDVGNRRWMKLDEGKKFIGWLSEAARSAPRSVVVACSRFKSVVVGRKNLFGRSFQFEVFSFQRRGRGVANSRKG